MANTIELPNLKFFQWQRPGASNPRLEIGIGLTDTTIVVSNPPLDENGDVITGNFIFGVRNTDSYVENIYVPPGEVSVDGLTFTNVVRGVNLTGLDYNTSVPSLIAKHGADSPVSCNVTAVYESILAACLRGQTVRTNGVDFILGTGSAETVTISRDDGTVKGWLRFNDGTQTVQYSSDGSTWVNITAAASDSLVAITASDTSPGYLDDKLVVTSNNPVLSIQTNVLNPGGGEDLEIEVDLDTVVTSAGAADADKVVVTGADGKIDESLLNIKTKTTIYGRNSYGASNTQFDITKSGDVVTYTYDGTGTDPLIGNHSMIKGQFINIISDNFNAANTGDFEVTEVGVNFFKINNPSGVAENNVTRGTGRIGSPNTWNKPQNLDHIEVVLYGAGGIGGSGAAGSGAEGGSGGGGGACRHIPQILSKDLQSTESIVVGIGTTGNNKDTTFAGYTGYSGGNGGYATAYGGRGGGELEAGVNGSGTWSPGAKPFGTTSAFSVQGQDRTDTGAIGGQGGFNTTGSMSSSSIEYATLPAVFGGGVGGARIGYVYTSAHAGSSSVYGGCGGGCGGRSSTPTGANGALRGTYTRGNGALGGGPGASGADGVNPGDSGGGGGGINSALPGGRGGNGAMPSGGGGGGGGSIAGGTGGLGGYGGDGMIKITEYFI